MYRAMLTQKEQNMVMAWLARLFGARRAGERRKVGRESVVWDGRCPDCGSTRFHEGSSGGLLDEHECVRLSARFTVASGSCALTQRLARPPVGPCQASASAGGAPLVSAPGRASLCSARQRRVTIGDRNFCCGMGARREPAAGRLRPIIRGWCLGAATVPNSRPNAGPRHRIPRHRHAASARRALPKSRQASVPVQP